MPDEVSRFTAATDDRLAALAAEHGLPPAAPGQLAVVLRALEAAEIAVSSVRVPGAAVEVHVADSLAALRLSAVRQARVIADLGSGGGFPGLALAAALPAAEVFLVESIGKKCDFLRSTASEAGLRNVVVVRARAEDWAAGIGSSELVTARALAPLPVLIEYAAPLLRLGGALVAWKGTPDAAEVSDGAAAAAALGLAPGAAESVEPYPGSGKRTLYVYSKVRETPRGYPRRPGMARKRPLRASTSP